MEITLRDYQQDACNQVWQSLEDGVLRLVVSLPTGGGKTILAHSLIKGGLARDMKKIAFIADRVALVDQTVNTFVKYGLYCGEQQGVRRRGHSFPTQVISAGVAIRGTCDLEQFDMVIIDECHTLWKTLMQRLKKANVIVVGLTATPFTPELGHWYDEIISVATTTTLLSRGVLAPLAVYRADMEVDMEGQRGKSRGGEWSGNQVAEQGKKIMGDIIAEWEKRTHAEFGGPVRTLVFAPTVAYAANLVGSFKERGHPFGLVSYKDSWNERQEKLDGLRKGRYWGLISVDALSKGLDIPEIMCLSTVRAYRTSLAAWIQTLGRGMRSAPKKEKCLLLDHSGNWLRHFERTVSFWENGVDCLPTPENKEVIETVKREVFPYVCDCGYIFPLYAKDPICPSCGALRPEKVEDEIEQDKEKNLEHDGTYTAEEIAQQAAAVRGRYPFLADFDKLAAGMTDW